VCAATGEAGAVPGDVSPAVNEQDAPCGDAAERPRQPTAVLEADAEQRRRR